MVTVLLKSKTNFRGKGACYFVTNSAILVFPCCLFPFRLYSLNLCWYIYTASASSFPALLALCEAQAAFLTLEPSMSDGALGSRGPTTWAVSPMLLEQNISEAGGHLPIPFHAQSGLSQVLQEQWVARRRRLEHAQASIC